MLLNKAKLEQIKVDQYLADIRQQKITDAFYLPKGQGVDQESVAFFSQVLSCDAKSLVKDVKPESLFALSQNGFYLLLTKLSIHFLRYGEIVSITT